MIKTIFSVIGVVCIALCLLSVGTFAATHHVGGDGTYTYDVMHAISGIITGNLDVGGYVLSLNTFNQSHASLRTNHTETITTTDTWLNMSFDCPCGNDMYNIEHSIIGITNISLHILDNGSYHIKTHGNFIDTSSSPKSTIATRVTKNGQHIAGLYKEETPIKQNYAIDIDKEFDSDFVTGDIVTFQYITDESTVKLFNSGLWAIYNTTATFDLNRVR